MSHQLASSNGAVAHDVDETVSCTTTSCGRTVLVLKDSEGECLEVHSPDGALEVHIAFTEHGPVLRLHTGRLELNTDDDVSINCRRFAVNAEEGVHVAGKEFRAKTEKDIVLNGAFIRLNCDEEAPPPKE